MTSEGRSFKRLPETDHRFQVPLILNEVGGIFYAPLAQMGEHSTFNRKRQIRKCREIFGIFL